MCKQIQFVTNTFHLNIGHSVVYCPAFKILKNTYAMWQLKIIIEISSRKELLGPIWSLPWGQAALFPPVHSPALSRLVGSVWK